MFETLPSSNCPSCGSYLNFRIKEAVAIVCPNCRDVIEREAGGLKALYKVMPMPEDMSLLRVGATGTWENREFVLMGRIRYQFDDGYENCWLMSFMEGKKRWLSEGYGIYCVCEPVKYDLKIEAVGRIKLGDTVGKPLSSMHEVVAIRNCRSVVPEGELMDVPVKDMKFLAIELVSKAKPGEMAAIDIVDKTEIETVTGRFVEFAELNIKNTRPLNGWT